MLCTQENTVKDETFINTIDLLKYGAFIVWITFWLTWLILAVISKSLGVFKWVLIIAILAVLIGTFIVAVALICLEAAMLACF
jgi:hypothetical protein